MSHCLHFVRRGNRECVASVKPRQNIHYAIDHHGQRVNSTSTTMSTTAAAIMQANTIFSRVVMSSEQHAKSTPQRTGIDPAERKRSRMRFKQGVPVSAVVTLPGMLRLRRRERGGSPRAREAPRLLPTRGVHHDVCAPEFRQKSVPMTSRKPERCQTGSAELRHAVCNGG